MVFFAGSLTAIQKEKKRNVIKATFVLVKFPFNNDELLLFQVIDCPLNEKLRLKCQTTMLKRFYLSSIRTEIIGLS